MVEITNVTSPAKAAPKTAKSPKIVPSSSENSGSSSEYVQLDENLSAIAKSVCKLSMKDGVVMLAARSGSGFLCKVKAGKWSYGLMTSNRVITQKMIDEIAAVSAEFEDGITVCLTLGHDTNTYFCSEALGVTFVEFSPQVLENVLGEKRLHFLPLLLGSGVERGQQVLVTQFPQPWSAVKGTQFVRSRVIKLRPRFHDFKHMTTTSPVLGGSPVIDEWYRIVGVHKADFRANGCCSAASMQPILNAMARHKTGVWKVHTGITPRSTCEFCEVSRPTLRPKEAENSSPATQKRNSSAKAAGPNIVIWTMLKDRGIIGDGWALSDNQFMDMFKKTGIQDAIATYKEQLLVAEKQQEFFNACYDGNLKRVRQVVAEGNVDVNVRYHWQKHGKVGGNSAYNGWSALLFAIEQGHLGVVEFLINSGAVKTGLMKAVENGHRQVAEYLISQAGLDVNEKQDEHGSRVLTAAAVRGDLDLVEFLINAGALVNEKNEFGETALMAACGGGHLAVVKALTEKHGADCNARATIKHEAGNDFGRVREFVSPSPKPLSRRASKSVLMGEEKGETAMIIAARNGKLAVVEYLVKRDGESSAPPNSAVSADLETALMWASSNGHLAIVEFLVKIAGTSGNKSTSCCGWTALTAASDNGHIDVVEFLVREAGVDVNKKGPRGLTPLIAAARRGDLLLVDFLLQQRTIKVNEKDGDGKTAFERASAYGRQDVADRLLRHMVSEKRGKLTTTTTTTINTADCNNN